MLTVRANRNKQLRWAGFSLLETLAALILVAVGLAALLGLHNTQQMQQAEAKTRADTAVNAEAHPIVE